MKSLHTTTLQLSSLAFIVLAMTACGPFTGDPLGQPEAEDFDRSCSQDSECTIVWLSRACSCSERASVNVSEQDAVDRANERESRHEGRCRTIVDCGAPLPAEAYCHAGTCDLRPESEPGVDE